MAIKVSPFQELINFVNERGGMTFWNYPEQKSGVRRHGPIKVNTPPYPQVLYQSKDYTGFASIYGDNIKATDPGMAWDRILCLNIAGVKGTVPLGNLNRRFS